MLAEQVLIDSLSFYGDTLVVVCYHVAQTYSTPEAEEREAFYATSEPTPYVIFDGTDVVWEQSPSAYKDVYTQHINAARSVTPYFNLFINSATADLDNGIIDLRIIAADTLPEDEMVAFVAIMEDSLPAAYGTFNHVLQSLFEFDINLAYPDTLDTTIIFTHGIPVNNMRTVIFVQNMDTKEVMQAIISTFEEE